MTTKQGTTSNYLLPIYADVELDFGPWPGLVVANVSAPEVLERAWGMSRAEARRRVQAGGLIDEYGEAVQLKDKVEPGCQWFTTRDWHVINFQRRPLNVYEAVFGVCLEALVYGFIYGLQESL